LVAIVVRTVEVAEVLMKVQLATCSIKHNATRQTCGQRWYSSMHSNLYIMWRWIINFCSWLLYSHTKGPHYQFVRRSVGYQRGVCMMWKTKHVPWPGIETLQPDRRPVRIPVGTMRQPCACSQIWAVQVRCKAMNSAVAEDRHISKDSAGQLIAVSDPAPSERLHNTLTRVTVRTGLSWFGETRVHKINKIVYVNLCRDLHLVRLSW
jgi:hypothetical protein